MTEHLPLWSRRLLIRLSVSPFRLVAYLLHATGLDHIYKPRFARHVALLELTDELVDKLPKYCYSMTGGQADPINHIFVARELDLKLAFKTAGWYHANPASPLHLLYALMTILIKRPYHSGPFTPLYVNIALQDLAYQRFTKKNNFRQRHHLRIWRTGITLSDNKRVWVAASSYDKTIKLVWRFPFLMHKIDANIDKERDFVVRTLENVGAAKLKTVHLIPAAPASAPATNVFGCKYFTDGRAAVVEL